MVFFSIKKITVASSLIFLMLAVPTIARAQSLSERIMAQVNGGARSASYSVEVGSPQVYATEAIQLFLGLLATIFFILILMSGFWLITARGEDEKYEKAMYTIKRAVIGFFIVIASYAIVNVVSSTIIKSTLPQTSVIHCLPRYNGVLDTNACARYTDEQSCVNAEVLDSRGECYWLP